MRNTLIAARNFLFVFLLILLCVGMFACGKSQTSASATEDVISTTAPQATPTQSKPPAIQPSVSTSPTPTPTTRSTPPEAQLSTDPLGLMKAGVLSMTKEEFELSDIFLENVFEPSTETADGFWLYQSKAELAWINENDSASFTGEPSELKWISYHSNGSDSISMIDSMYELEKQLTAQYGARERGELAFIDKDDNEGYIKSFDTAEIKKILAQGIQSMGGGVSWQADDHRVGLHFTIYTGDKDSCTVTLEYSNII